jgi:hypothetical protein
MEVNREFQKGYSLETKRPEAYMSYEMQILNLSPSLSKKERQSRFIDLLDYDLEGLGEERGV